MIELLVVIAIIAILAAILFPVFAQARNKARAAVCLSNQKQISMGFTMYAQDYDDTMCFARSWCGGVSDRDYTTLLSSYIMNARGPAAQKQAILYTCPNDSTERQKYGDTSSESTTSDAKNSYAAIFDWNGGDHAAAWEWDVPCPGDSGKFFPGRPLSDFRAPGSTLILAEKPSKQNVIGYNTSFVMRPSGNLGQDCVSGDDWSPCLASETIKPPHNLGWNYMFADGHVKWCRPETTVDGNPGDAYTGTVLDPRGYWTIKEDD